MVNNIKIIFLCGSLEPGRDGVGDYTRRLAAELVRQGHQAGIIALNDQHFTEEFNGVQESGDITLPVLRLPSTWVRVRRFQRADVWIADFCPDWLSLQFVPFSFHPKGLGFGMGKLLKKLGNGKRWHIMVHELWVGMDKEASFKFVFWGWLQRRLIKSLLTKLKPGIINTQTRLYMKMLEKIGFKGQYLPLFGNISVRSKVISNGSPTIDEDNFSKAISCVVFGGIHPGAAIGAFAKELKLYSMEKEIPVSLTMIGRCGSEQLRWKEECEAVGLQVKILGEQSPEYISGVLRNSSFGISTTPDALIEKSGSVAAMREHGLNIVSISRSWHPRGFVPSELPPGIVKYEKGNIQSFIDSNLKSHNENNILAITSQFINKLLSSV